MTLKNPVPVELVHPIGLYPSQVPSTLSQLCLHFSLTASRASGVFRAKANKQQRFMFAANHVLLAWHFSYTFLRSAMKYSALRSLNTKEQIFFSQVQKWRRLYCSHFGCLMLSACCFTTLLLCLRARLLCAQMRVSHGFTTSNFVVFSGFLCPSNGGQSTCDIS